MSELVNVIISADPSIRNMSLDKVCTGKPLNYLLHECHQLEQFRKKSGNLYEKVRALFFLYAIHRFYIPFCDGVSAKAVTPWHAYDHILNRRFEEAIDILLRVQSAVGPNEGVSSALADACHKLAFQTLADQVKKSVRSVPGNQWMFRIGHPDDHPLRWNRQLMVRNPETGLYPLLKESTPVRMDLSHSCWSDIFFLGMDYPEGAKVLNISVDLCINDEKNIPGPPVETWIRVIDEPMIRIVSTDLEASAEIHNISEIFDFAKDYLGLLKAALIASGIVPPAMEGVNLPVSRLLEKILAPGLGFELVSQVNNIPKGSRLAVSTNLLASLISLCMRVTSQTSQVEGSPAEEERRLIAAKAILGEWLGGSGGGWQDSGGVWPGIKKICGSMAAEGDPEFGISKGKLLPSHEILTEKAVSAETRQKLQDSLVIVHGGMAQNVGPVLEMVTEKYLLRSEQEWKARQKALQYFDEIVGHLLEGNIKELGRLTQENFDGPIQDIIPAATNAYTEIIISRTRKKYKTQFWGFWMMGGMSGGGMGFIFDPAVKQQAQGWLLQTMKQVKKEMEQSMPFAMDPVVYDFRVNETGTAATLYTCEKAILPVSYYTLLLPAILKQNVSDLPPYRKAEISILSKSHKVIGSYSSFVSELFDRMIPEAGNQQDQDRSLKEILNNYGFDATLHHTVKSGLKSGQTGLSKNRLPVNIRITDPVDGETDDAQVYDKNTVELGAGALKNRELAIVTLAGGIGSRWTKGAGVVKSLHPFVRFENKHRSFVEIHLAKNRKTSQEFDTLIPHVFTTSYLTHAPIKKYLQSAPTDKQTKVFLSEGRFIGLRLYPTERDLRFYWDEMARQVLDEQSQKLQDSLHNALIKWAKNNGEAEDYLDNIPHQCIHPVGHWFEIPNLLLNGTLSSLIELNPRLKYLLIHNIDTLGTDADPIILGKHIESENTITGEIISRWIDDRGGGLAKINHDVRLIEGMALPDEKIEFNLSWYNTNTFWVSIDPMLQIFSLTRDDLNDKEKIRSAIMEVARQMPTYMTIKEVKKRWGKGQEDIYPVMQFEKLWGDMTALPALKKGFIRVSRRRGQQLKDISQLDGWLRDGSAQYVNSLCRWEELQKESEELQSSGAHLNLE